MRTKLLFGILLVLASLAATAGAQSNTFTYQGRLTDNNLAAVGTYEMQFRVFDAAVAGNQLPQPTPITLTFTVAGTNPVTVSNGAFTVHLNFGANVFTGADRWLEISVRKPSDPPGFTLLTPRQPITSSPYAIKTINANAADSVTAACVLCITDAHISGIDGSKVTGTVANAANAATAASATTAGNVSGVVAIANGGTGSATQNFVDLTTNQTVGGTKTFANPPVGNGSQLTNINGANITNNSINGSALAFGAASRIDAGLLATLRWDLLAAPKTIQVGSIFPGLNNSPQQIAFDGTNIWVATNLGGELTKLRASDGASQGTFTINGSAQWSGIAFDGANIWVSDRHNGPVFKVRASDGAVLGTFAAEMIPYGGLAFDGTNIWAAGTYSGNGRVVKLRPSDGAIQGIFPVGSVGSAPAAMAFDGQNIWVAISDGTVGTIEKRLASTGALLATYALSSSCPTKVAFDGVNIWVTNSCSGNITKLLAATGAVQGTIAVGANPYGLAFDGTNVWVANWGSNNLTKLRANDGSVQGTFPVGTQPIAVAFDGASIWVANSGASTVTKLPIFP